MMLFVACFTISSAIMATIADRKGKEGVADMCGSCCIIGGLVLAVARLFA